MTNQGKPVVFVVDDDHNIREAISWLLESVRLNVESFASATAFLQAYSSTIVPVVWCWTCGCPA